MVKTQPSDITKAFDEAIEDQRTKELVICSTRKLTTEQLELIQERLLGAPCSDYLSFFTTCTTENTPITHSLTLPEDSESFQFHLEQEIEGFVIEDPDGIFEESNEKQRSCPICECELKYSEYLVRNKFTTCSTSETIPSRERIEYLRMIWEDLRVQIPCCQCYIDLEEIHFCEEYTTCESDEYEDIKIKNFKRFGLL